MLKKTDNIDSNILQIVLNQLPVIQTETSTLSLYHHQSLALYPACRETIMTVWVCFHLGGHQHDRRLQRD